VVRSAKVTLRYIIAFFLLLTLSSLTPLLFGCGVIYLVTALLSASGLLLRLYRLWRDPILWRYKALFHFSILYLLILLAGIIADRIAAG
jgi:heme O synthase-like polyprenyltransferase